MHSSPPPFPRSYKRFYTPGEFYRILLLGLRTAPRLLRSRRGGELDPEFVERIMLAVTEVNGCEVCSYAHARMALAQGMSREEIQKLLSGNTEGVPAEEAVGIAFAQHYADSRGNPDPAAWLRLVEAYGSTRAFGILGAARVMMIGNAYGIPWSALLSRLRGRPIRNSSIPYEAGMLLAIIVFLPVAALHALASGPFARP